jgi:hypothetical protein
MLKLYFLQANDVGIAFTQKSLQPRQPSRPCQGVFGAMLKIGPGTAWNANVTICEYVQRQDCHALRSRGYDSIQPKTLISVNILSNARETHENEDGGIAQLVHAAIKRCSSTATSALAALLQHEYIPKSCCPRMCSG